MSTLGWGDYWFFWNTSPHSTNIHRKAAWLSELKFFSAYELASVCKSLIIITVLITIRIIILISVTKIATIIKAIDSKVRI